MKTLPDGVTDREIERAHGDAGICPDCGTEYDADGSCDCDEPDPDEVSAATWRAWRRAQRRRSR